MTTPDIDRIRERWFRDGIFGSRVGADFVTLLAAIDERDKRITELEAKWMKCVNCGQSFQDALDTAKELTDARARITELELQIADHNRRSDNFPLVRPKIRRRPGGNS